MGNLIHLPTAAAKPVRNSVRSGRKPQGIASFGAARRKHRAEAEYQERQAREFRELAGSKTMGWNLVIEVLGRAMDNMTEMQRMTAGNLLEMLSRDPEDPRKRKWLAEHFSDPSGGAAG